MVTVLKEKLQISEFFFSVYHCIGSSSLSFCLFSFSCGVYWDLVQEFVFGKMFSVQISFTACSSD